MTRHPLEAAKLEAWSWRLARLLVIVVGLHQAWGLYETYLQSTRLPLWDMAQNGGQAVELADDVRTLRPARFLWHLNEHDKWPFAYSLLLAPFLLIGGSSYAAATLPSALFFAFTPLALLAVARRVDGGVMGLWAGLLASGLWLSSPEVRLFAILIQREAPGALFTLVALVAYGNAVRTDSLRSWRRAAFSALALLFLKFNYGIAWLVSVALYETLRRTAAERRRWLTFAVHYLQPWQRTGWRTRSIGVLLYVTALVVLTGGNPGTVIYAAIVLATCVFAVDWLRDPRRPGNWLASLPASVRATIELFVVPLWIWCLSPSPIHPRDVFRFLDNRNSGLPLGHSILFYPKSLLGDYLPAVALGFPLVIGLVLALGYARRSTTPRLLLLFCAVMSALALLHPYKQPRFILTLVPALFLASALGLSWAAFGLRPRGRTRTIVGSVVLGALLAAALFRAGMPDAERLARAYENQSGDPRLTALLDDLPALLGSARRVGFVGTFNELSPWLLAWATYAGSDSRDLQAVPNLPVLPADLPAAEARRRTRSWASRQGLDAIAAIRLDSASHWAQSDDYQSHNVWQETVLRALDEDPSWVASQHRSYPQLELELTIFRPAASGRF